MQCLIDLKANVLRFSTTDAALPFLPEHEIPKNELLDLPEGDPRDAAMPDAAAPAPQQQQQQPAPQQDRPGGAGGAAAAGACRVMREQLMG
jgi:hypothetical protein